MNHAEIAVEWDKLADAVETHRNARQAKRAARQGADGEYTEEFNYDYLGDTEKILNLRAVAENTRHCAEDRQLIISRDTAARDWNLSGAAWHKESSALYASMVAASLRQAEAIEELARVLGGKGSP